MEWPVGAMRAFGCVPNCVSIHSLVWGRGEFPSAECRKREREREKRRARSCMEFSQAGNAAVETRERERRGDKAESTRLGECVSASKAEAKVVSNDAA